MFQLPEDATEEANRALRVAFGEVDTAKQQAQIMAVRCAHLRRRIIGGFHHLLENSCQAIQGGGWDGMALHACRGFLRRRSRCPLVGINAAGRQLVKAYGHRLAEIHRRLLGGGRDLDEYMAMGKFLAGKAALLRAKNKCSTAAAGDLLMDPRRQVWKRNYRLLRPAMGEASGTGYEAAIGDGFGKSGAFGGALEQAGSAYGGTRLPPVGPVRRNHSQARESEVGHRAGGGANVERIAGGDENDEKPVALGAGQQTYSVVPIPGPKKAGPGAA